MEVVSLLDRLDLVQICAAWAYAQWGGAHPNAQAVAALWRRQVCAAGREGLPHRFVALRDGRAVGTASLVLDDSASRPELGPWLADVVVPPDQRRRGIATAMVGHAEAFAAAVGIERLYLITTDTEGLYAGLGWRRLGRTRDDLGRPAVLMDKRVLA